MLLTTFIKRHFVVKDAIGFITLDISLSGGHVISGFISSLLNLRMTILSMHEDVMQKIYIYSDLF